MTRSDLTAVLNFLIARRVIAADVAYRLLLDLEREQGLDAGTYIDL